MDKLSYVHVQNHREFATADVNYMYTPRNKVVRGIVFLAVYQSVSHSISSVCKCNFS